MNLDALHIAHPELVHGLWLWALLVGLFVWLEQRGSDRLKRLVGRTLEDRLVEGPAPWRRWLRLGLVALAGFLMVVALMRPQWGERFVATPRVGAEIMIALDVSRSMLADDAKPSRLERAKAEISDLLAYLQNDQVGLIAFAGRASILSPMTPDRSFLRLALDGAGPHSVSRGGTRLAEPILRAIASLGEPGPAQRALILITDGEDHDAFALDAAKKAAEAGIKIITIGFGDEAGSPIFVQDPDDGSRTQVRDSEGNPVISRLDGDLLREIALATDGAYVPAGMGVLDLASIYDAHIARLTRGQLDARGRSIRGELYQAFVAAALICLVLGVSVTAGGVRGNGSERTRGHAPARSEASPRPAASSIAVVGSAVALAVAATFAPVAAPRAQAAEDPAPATAPAPPRAPAASEDPAAAPVAAPSAQAAPEAAPAVGSTTPPDEDPRTRFNRANERLAAGDPALASTLYREARRDAVDDLELRYAASYNLGMAAVAQADAVQASEPNEALARLHEAADWFREASAMQPDEAEPRHNLDVTLRRVLILADEIARKSQRDLEGELDRLIETQRGRVAETALLLESVARAEEPGAVDALRPAFDAAATVQRELLADVEDLAERAANEKAILDAKSPDSRSPEDALRGASLEGVLRYLDQGVERMGQARRQLRLRSAERAYRRGSESLDSLKRARDQLRDPVEQIGVLIGEVEGVGRATASLAGAAASPEAVDALPAFLTPEQVGSENAAVEARVGELAERFTAAAEQADAGAGADPSAGSPPTAGDSPNESPSMPESLRAALRGAAPLIRDAHSALGRATAALTEKKFEPALTGQGEASGALAEARELFFDLRQLLAVSYEAESRIAGVARSEDANVLELRVRSESALAAEQSRNRGRATRLDTLLAAEREAALEALDSPESDTAKEEGAAPPPPPDPAQRAALEQRFEQASTLLAEAASAMDEAGSAFDGRSEGRSDGESAGAARAADWPRVGVAAGRAAERLDALRMLFSTLLEQLQRLERDQIDLSDRTRDAIALAAADEPPGERSAETRGRIGVIDGAQKSLESRAGAIADALVARSEAMAADPAAAGTDAPGGNAAEPDADTLRRAADHVATAQLSMQSAGGTFQDESLPLPPAADAQTVAREELRKALELLSPPPQQKPEESEPQEQEPQSGEDESPSDSGDSGDSAGDPGQPEPAQPEPGEGGAQPEPQPGEDEAASASEDEGAQLLQGVRDREAERRAANERKARIQRRSAPVEKDW